MNVDHRLHVFLVEDNEDTRSVLTQLLEATGCEVRAAGSVQAALDGFPASSSEVLLSDVGLPDGDGWSLLRSLRRSGWAPYAIAMSGYGTLADVARSREAGFRHHLVKPVEWDTLERLLDDVRHEIHEAR